MLATTRHQGPSRLARSGRALAGLAAFAAALATAGSALADMPDHEAVLSALGAPASGSTSFAGQGNRLPDEPSRVLGGSLMAAVPVWSRVSVEMAGLGYRVSTRDPAASGQALSGPEPAALADAAATGVGLMAGLRLTFPAERLRPYATARIAHLFHATNAHWRAYPLQSILGTTPEGLRHPVGAALGAGVEAPLAGRSSPWRPVLDVGVRVVERPEAGSEVVINCQLRFETPDFLPR